MNEYRLMSPDSRFDQRLKNACERLDTEFQVARRDNSCTVCSSNQYESMA